MMTSYNVRARFPLVPRRCVLPGRMILVPALEATGLPVDELRAFVFLFVASRINPTTPS
jgi:hypothetical protein